MALAVIGTLLHPEIVSYTWILVALVRRHGDRRAAVVGAADRGAAADGAVARVRRPRGGPGRHGEVHLWLQDGELTAFRTVAIVVEVLLGYLTFTGSLMAAGKLQEVLPTRPITYRNQNVVNLAAARDRDRRRPLPGRRARTTWQLFPVVVVLSLRVRRAAGHPDRRRRHADGDLAAELVRRPVGRGDGLRAREQAAHHRRRARRLVGLHPVDHHVQGDEPLVHQRAVRRVRPGRRLQAATARRKTVKSATPRTPPTSWRTPSSVVIVPGYGMAVAQAQHRVRELYDQLTKRGIDVKFAIHPVAGRMPGHMNVLLAEAEIPYDALVEMDDINPDMPQVDVALVIGANDVVEPGRAPRQDQPDLRHADHRRRQGQDRASPSSAR